MLSFDPLSLLFIGVIVLATVPALVHLPGYLRGDYRWGKIAATWALLAAFAGSMFLAVTVTNALLFLLVWGSMSLFSYFLIVFDSGREESVKPALAYSIYSQVGTAFIISAFLILYYHAATFSFHSFHEISPSLPAHIKSLLFVLFLAGFGSKAGIFPFHSGIPVAYSSAPLPVSGVMSGVMTKIALYGMLRFILIVGVDASWCGYVVMALAAITMLIGAYRSLSENELVRLLSTQSIQNVGMIFLAMGGAVVLVKVNKPLIGVLALSAGLFLTVSHALASFLFLVAGNIRKKAGATDFEKLGGLARKMPWTAAVFLCGALALSALPPFGGVVGVWLVLQSLFSGAFMSGDVRILFTLYAIMLLFSLLISAVCFAYAMGSIFLGKPRTKDAENSSEVSFIMGTAVSFLAFCSLMTGLAASPLLNFLKGVASYTLNVNTFGINFTLNDFFLNPPAPEVFLSVPMFTLLFVTVASAIYLLLSAKYPAGNINYGPQSDAGASPPIRSLTPMEAAHRFFLQPLFKKETSPDIPHLFFYEKCLGAISRERSGLSVVISRLLRGASKILLRLEAGGIAMYWSSVIIVLLLVIIFL